MRRPAIRVARLSSRHRTSFGSCSSSRATTLVTATIRPVCQPWANTITRRVAVLSTSAPASTSNHAEERYLSRNARDIHSSAKAAAAAHALAVEEEEPDYEAWDYPAAYDETPYIRAEPSSGPSRDQWVDHDPIPPVPEWNTELDDRPVPLEYTDELADAPAWDAFDPTAPPSPKAKRRRRKREALPPLPPLPVGEMPEDGMSRFDWRETSISTRPKAKSGKLWYPDQARIRRLDAGAEKLWAEGEFDHEVERYINQYVSHSHGP